MQGARTKSYVQGQWPCRTAHPPWKCGGCFWPVCSWIIGLAGRQVRYQNPQTSVREAKKQERFSEIFTRSLTSQSASNPGRPVDRTVRGIALGAQPTLAQVTTWAVSSIELGTAPISQWPQQVRGMSKPGPKMRCECEGRGHFARECPTRLKGARTRNSPGKGNPSGRSTRPRFSDDETPSPTKWGGKQETHNQGND